MIDVLGTVFTKILQTMNGIYVLGKVTLLDFSIGLSVFGLGVAAFKAIFASGGDT